MAVRAPDTETRPQEEQPDKAEPVPRGDTHTDCRTSNQVVPAQERSPSLAGAASSCIILSDARFPRCDGPKRSQ
jgi:hypothetical protein